MRYLFVTVDGGGNLYPEVAVAARLARRGHQVRFLGNRSQRTAIERAGFACATYQRAPDIDAAASETSQFKDWAVDPGTAFAALCDHLWFGPGALFAADVTAEVKRCPTDALAVDYFVYGALAAAENARIPTAVLWHTTFGEWEVLNQGLPALNAARAQIGLPPLATVFEQYRRMDRVLILTDRSFDFAITPMKLPPNACHVGPQLPPSTHGASTAGNPQRPLVLASLSTSYQAQEDLLRQVVAALGTLPVHGLVTTGPAVALDGDRPANVEVTAWIPHTDVLPHASLVITHGGLGTVNAAMAHGVPMLCLPMGRDQHGNVARVEHLGLGHVLLADASASEIAAAAGKALADPALYHNAARHADTIRAHLAGDPAVTYLEALLTPQLPMKARTSNAV